jgi:hypothetical protein
MPVIRISDELFSRLEAYAVGFDTPAAVIERLLNERENISDKEIHDELFSTSSNSEVIAIHDKIFQFLLDYKAQHPDFYFMPRQKGKRLEDCYWFPGDDNYLVIGFYTGPDDFNKTPNITFQIYLSSHYLRALNRAQIPTCVIQLSNTPESKGWLTKKPVIEKIIQKLGGFEVNRITDGVDARWNRYYESNDIFECLEEFLTKDKPVIDEIIRKEGNPEIGFLDKKKADDKINNIVNRRNRD